MPVIAEEDEGASFIDQDFSSLLDLPGTEYAGAGNPFNGSVAPACLAETHDQDSIEYVTFPDREIEV